MSPQPLVWDISIQRQLRQGAARFQLDVRLASAAQRLVLHGPSGAGKTQTLRVIAGIDRPDAGRVEVAGTLMLDVSGGLHLSPQERRLPVVFQEYALFPHLTVRQNIAFATRRGWRNPGQDLDDAQVERWIEAFRLQAVVSLKPHQLSGGQRQRTALARALMTGPRALLLDEPFTAVDAPLRRHLREELLALQADLALPMLLITHDDEDVRHFAQDVVELAEGRVAQSPPADGGA